MNLQSFIRTALGRKLVAGVTGTLLASTLIGGTVLASSKTTTFDMVPSGGVLSCLPKASAHVTVTKLGPVETMKIEVKGLPAKTDFDTFITQVPNPPFGVSWYQGDFETDGSGKGSQTYIGRFNNETFALAPGSAAAPKLHDQDAGTNPQFGPIHTFHVGLWFNSPADAKKAGCPDITTPFNGEHNAGIQALSTRNFADDKGPLRNIK